MDFSVLMSVYNKERPDYFEFCCESLTRQTLLPTEVVIVNDGPLCEKLRYVISKYSSRLNIINIVLEQNVGLARALNEGLKHCTHELVARMDSDDMAMPERFEKQIAFMQSNLDVAVSSGVIEEFNEAGQVTFKRVLPLAHSEITSFAKKRSPLSHPAVIFRKSAILDVGGYPEIYPEDYLLWVKLIQKGYRLANLPDTLLKMRTGDQFITRRGYRFLIGELRIYRYMYQTKFITLFEYLKVISERCILRLSPSFVKLFLYKVAR